MFIILLQLKVKERIWQLNMYYVIMMRKNYLKIKERILPELVEYALKYGNKPAARKYFTYPSTIRNWVKRYNEFGLEGLKIKK